MKKIISALVLSILTTTAIFAETSYFTEEQQGTYIPQAAYNALVKTHSYFEAIQATSGNEFYTVLSIEDNKIQSNVKFHDAYTVRTQDDNGFTFSTNNGQQYIMDNHTEITYIKISDSTDYYTAYRNFLTQNIPALEANKIPQEDGTYFFYAPNWIIDLDQWHYSSGVQILLYNTVTNMYVGLINDKLFLFTNYDDLLLTPIIQATIN